MDDAELYLRATNEVESGDTDKAQWSKAMALVSGDNGRAKYKYVELRVAQWIEAAADSGRAKVGSKICSDTLDPGLGTSSRSEPIKRAETGKTPPSIDHAPLEEQAQAFKLVSFAAKEWGIDSDTLIGLIQEGKIAGRSVDGDWYVDAANKLPSDVFSVQSIEAFANDTVVRKIDGGVYAGYRRGRSLFVDIVKTDFPPEFSVEEYSQLASLPQKALLEDIQEKRRKSRRGDSGDFLVAYSADDFRKKSKLGRSEPGNRRHSGSSRKSHELNALATPNTGFFTQLVRGDAGLFWTFWVFGVLAHLFVTILGVGFKHAGLWKAVWAVVAIDLVYWPVLLIGLWRAANRYSGARVWSLSAKVFVVLGWWLFFGGLTKLLLDASGL